MYSNEIKNEIFCVSIVKKFLHRKWNHETKRSFIISRLVRNKSIITGLKFALFSGTPYESAEVHVNRDELGPLSYREFHVQDLPTWNLKLTIAVQISISLAKVLI